jgi:quinol monooxygenase YgiN
MVTKALLVRLEALPGKEAELASFLEGARSIVMEEPGTTAWFAIQIGPSTFGVFDVFPDDEARDAHLAGGVGQALGPKHRSAVFRALDREDRHPRGQVAVAGSSARAFAQARGLAAAHRRVAPARQ